MTTQRGVGPTERRSFVPARRQLAASGPEDAVAVMRSAPVPQRDAVGGGGTRQPGRPGSPRRCSINEATARPASVFIKHLGRQM